MRITPYIAMALAIILLPTCRPDPFTRQGAQVLSGNQEAPVSLLADGEELIPAPALQALMHKLYLAAEDQRLPEPVVVISGGREYAATYLARQNQIVVEEAALDICRQFGPDSAALMAFILGHEFGHLVQRTDARHGAGATFGYYNRNKKATSSSEGNADLYALFLCQLSGFAGVRERLPDFLEQLYQGYRFKDDMPAYPTKQARQSYSRMIGSRTDSLLQIWDAGMFLLALQEYTAAEACFDHVRAYFPGAEVWHNLGAAAALAAVTLLRRKDPEEWHYAFLPETRIRLEFFRASPGRDLDASIATELARAREALDIALRQKPGAANAHFNRILLYILEDDFAAARSALEKQRRRLSPEQTVYVQTLLECAVQDGSPASGALEPLRRLAQDTDPRIAASARLNAALLEGRLQDYLQRPCPPPDFFPDDLRPGDLRFSGADYLELNPQFRLAWRRLPNSVLLYFRPNDSAAAPIYLHHVCAPCPHPFSDLAPIGARLNRPDAPALRQSVVHRFHALGPCLPAVKTGSREKIESWAYLLPEGF